MPSKPRINHLLTFIFLLCGITTAIGWSGVKQENLNDLRTGKDTIPVKKHPRKENYQANCQKEIDKAIEKIKKTSSKVEERLDRMDWGLIGRKIEKSIKEVDFQQIMDESNKAVQHAEENVDFKKLEERIRRSLKRVKEKLNSTVAGINRKWEGKGRMDSDIFWAG